ncbi:MAG: SLBB domain-containing protein [Sphingomonadaceae bacterium]
MATRQLVLGMDRNGTASIAPRAVTPAKPGQFERYVEQAVGHKVKRFGSDLLLPADQNFTVPATTSIPADYPIQIGDIVRINLTGSIQGSADFQVDRNGQIFLPNVGKVDVAGVRYRDLRKTISQAIGLKYRGYEVTVGVKKLSGMRVYVTGFANNPGTYSVSSLSTMVNAVLAAGGPSAGGSFRRVELWRNGQLVKTFDLYDFIRRGDKSQDAILQNEDVLYIPPVGRQFAVVGSVNDEAIYEALPRESLERALAIAGGPDQLADKSRVILYRLDDQSTVGSREIAAASLSSTEVDGGDIIQVLSKGTLAQPLEHQRVLVRIEGEVEHPGNYYVAPNTPLSQVMALAGGLTPRAYVYGTKLYRQSVREQQRQSYYQALDQFEQMLAAAPLSSDPAFQQNNGAARLSAAKELLSDLRSKEPDGRLVLGIQPGGQSLPGDLALENNDRILIPPKVDTVGVFGAVYRPASFLIGDGKPLKVRDYLERAGGLQRYADKGRIFVVRASGDVVTKKDGALSDRVLPGDVIFVPIKTGSTSLLSKIRDFTQIFFQFGLAAATVAAIN